MQLKDLAPNPRNPRKITDKKLVQLEKSLKKFGSLDGIIFNKKTGRLIGGHQRQKVLKDGTIKGNWIEWNGHKFPYREVEWDEAMEKAANIAANKGAGEWDKEILGEWFSELKSLNFDLDLTMFDEDEIFFKEEEKKGLCDADATPETRATSICLGDLFALGNHRLLCGDSTDKAQVERLMNGEKADMVFTDPPYNVAQQGQNYASNFRKTYKKLEDSEWDYNFDPIPFLENSKGFISDNCFFYVCTSHRLFGIIVDWMEKTYGKSSFITWYKTNPMVSLAKTTWTFSTELIAYCRIGKPVFNFPPEGHAPNVWLIKRNQHNDLHPTMKPVEVPEHAIKHSSNPNQLILDQFLGSGSTLIACEKTNRKCYGMEIDPQYCQVIIDRWEKFTGQKALKLRENSEKTKPKSIKKS